MINLYNFGASWCHGCKIMKPIIDEILKDYPVLKRIDIDADDDKKGLLDKYMVRGLPTIIIESDDKKFTKRISGTVPGKVIIDAIETYLKSIL